MARFQRRPNFKFRHASGYHANGQEIRHSNDWSCGRYIKVSTCRPYAVEEMTMTDDLAHGPVSFKTVEPGYTLLVDGKALGIVEAKPGNLLVSPQLIFDSVRACCGVMANEHVVIASWPVQFLLPNSPLAEEALQQAVTQDVAGIPTRVLTRQKSRRHCLANRTQPRTRPGCCNSSNREN